LARYNSGLRYFFSQRVPDPSRVLLIESGSREVLEKLLPVIPQAFGPVAIDVCTCFSDRPANFTGRLLNINDYGPNARARLLTDIGAHPPQIVGILCTGEPIMTKWKWWLAWKLPTKVFLVNESGDFFWCDRGNLGFLWQLFLERAGLAGTGAVPALARLLFLPVTATFLLAYAATVHLRRRLRSA
jgi:hypothetical protein